MATVAIKFQNSLNWYIWFTSTSYHCWLNPLRTQAIFIILAVLVIKHVQRVSPKLHANRAIICTLTVTYGTLQKNKRSSVLNLRKQRQVCPSLFFQFNMRISVIYGTLSVLCKRVVQACRARAFTFSIKFLWRVTNGPSVPTYPSTEHMRSSPELAISYKSLYFSNLSLECVLQFAGIRKGLLSFQTNPKFMCK